MTYLTVRNLPADLARALEAEKRRRGVSLNQTVIALLQRSLGLGPLSRRGNGLARLAGSWTEADLRRFEAAVSMTEAIDPEL